MPRLGATTQQASSSGAERSAAQEEARRKAIVRATASAFIVSRDENINGQNARAAKLRHDVMAWDDVLVRASPAGSA